MPGAGGVAHGIANGCWPVGAGEHVRVPYKGRNKPASQKAANAAHAKVRRPGERANAQLKTWCILRKLRCCPLLAGQLVKAILPSTPRSGIKATQWSRKVS